MYSKLHAKTRYPFCIVGRCHYYVRDINIKPYIPVPTSALAITCHEIESVDRQFHKLILKWIEPQPNDYPEFVKLYESLKFKSYQDYFDQSTDFSLPYCDHLLYDEVGLEIAEKYTNMANAKGRYPPQEYAEDIRQKQASKLAFR